MRRVVEGLKEQLPGARRTMRFCTEKNAGMEDVLHGPVAQQKSECFRLVALRKIDIELCRRSQNRPLDGRVDPIVAVKHPGNRGNTDIRSGSKFPQTYFAFFKRLIAHAAKILDLVNCVPGPKGV